MLSRNYSYVNANGKRVYGAAANNHDIYTIHGGIENFTKNYINLGFGLAIMYIIPRLIIKHLQ